MAPSIPSTPPCQAPHNYYEPQITQPATMRPHSPSAYLWLQRRGQQEHCAELPPTVLYRATVQPCAYMYCCCPPVAAKTGAATITPSGMLCTAMAAAMMGPKDVKAEKPTAMPSGRLCSVMVSAMSSPSRNSSPERSLEAPLQGYKQSARLCSVMVSAISSPSRSSSPEHVTWNSKPRQVAKHHGQSF